MGNLDVKWPQSGNSSFEGLKEKYLRDLDLEKDLGKISFFKLSKVINWTPNLSLDNEDHAKVIKAFLKKISKLDLKDWLSEAEFESFKKTYDYNSTLSTINILFWEAKKVQGNDVLNAYREYLWFQKEQAITEVQKETKKEVEEVKAKVEASRKTKEKEDKESIRTSEKTDSSVEITFWFWNEDFKWLAKNINKASYDSMVRSMDYTSLESFYKSMQANLIKNNLKWEKYSFTPWNIGSLKDLFIKQWYKPDWFFGWIEMASLTQLIENVYKTQEKLRKENGFREKMAIIFDYNQDGLLDNKVNFVTKERQFFENIKTEDEFSNLLSNMWYKNANDFWSWFNQNYFAARKEFKDRLGTIYMNDDKVKISPDDLTRDPEALKKFNEYKKNVENEVNNAVDAKYKNKTLAQVTKDRIKLEAVWIILWSSNWVGASFNIKEATKSLIDNIWVGVWNWVPGVFISKNIIKEKNWKYSIDAWLANFIPFIWTTLEVYEWSENEFKELFPWNFNSWVKVNLSLWASLPWVWVWVWISRLNEETKAWIEKAKREMSKVLDKVFGEIKEWKIFEQSSFKDDINNKSAYERLEGLYKSSWWDIKWLKEWALKNYENYLYDNASGQVNLAWLWIWLAFANGFVYPTIWANFEKHSTGWREQETRTAIEPSNESIDIIPASFDRDELYDQLKGFEAAFSWRTRTNTWAKNFLDPNNDLKTRWQGLNKMASSTRALREAWLPKYLNSIKTDEDKRIVISTLSQYTKKANDYNDWDLEKWNNPETLNKYIEKDKKRRSSFDWLFWFSLQDEAKEYYKKLQEWKWKIWKANIKWISFDATSSANVGKNRTSVKWVDVLYTNLSMLTVGWKPLLVPVSQNKVENFKETLNSLKNMDDKTKADLIDKIGKWHVTLWFYKDPEWFDDRIIPYVTTPWVAPWPWTEVYNPEHSTTNFAVWVMAKIWWGNKNKEVKNEEPKEEVKQEPKKDETETSGKSNKPGSIPESNSPSSEPRQKVKDPLEQWIPVVEAENPVSVTSVPTVAPIDATNTWKGFPATQTPVSTDSTNQWRSR